jgi:hypothetical protein
LTGGGRPTPPPRQSPSDRRMIAVSPRSQESRPPIGGDGETLRVGEKQEPGTLRGCQAPDRRRSDRQEPKPDSFGRSHRCCAMARDKGRSVGNPTPGGHVPPADPLLQRHEEELPGGTRVPQARTTGFPHGNEAGPAARAPLQPEVPVERNRIVHHAASAASSRALDLCRSVSTGWAA